MNSSEDVSRSSEFQKSSPETHTAQWVDQIRSVGRSYLHGKFKAVWEINGHPIQFTQFGKEGAFSTIERIGKNFREPSSFDYLTSVGAQLQTIVEAREANYFVIGAPFEDRSNMGRELLTNGVYVPLHYYAWSHANFTPDARGSHALLDWGFYLPVEVATQFQVQVRIQPLTVEEVFREMHQGLIGEGGLQRVQVDKLRVIHTPADLNQAVARGIIKSRQFSEWPFSKSIGEQPKQL